MGKESNCTKFMPFLNYNENYLSFNLLTFTVLIPQPICSPQTPLSSSSHSSTRRRHTIRFFLSVYSPTLKPISVMADLSKQTNASGLGSSFISDMKNLFPLVRTRKSMVFAYGFMFTVIAFTAFLAFSPSSNSSSPWFNNIFSSDGGSHFPSFFSYFFSNSTNTSTSTNTNTTTRSPFQEPPFHHQPLPPSPSPSPSPIKVVNLTTPLLKQSVGNSTSSGISGKNGNLTEKKVLGVSSSLLHCDIFDGNWVKDDSYPLYTPGTCQHIDEQFSCFLNGRPDQDFQKYRWQPKGCNIPRLNGKNMLELLRGKRLVFVGDSLNRNMWESLLCILENSVDDKSKVYEASGRKEFRTENSYLFVFKEYNCTVEFFRSPFLVQEFEMPETNGSAKETLRLDTVEPSSAKYKTADYIVFNTGHWWTHPKTSKGKDYFQEGSHVYGELNVVEAFRKALTTWARWVDANVNSSKSLVLFRGYSASHFKGGQWNSGGQCDHETEPIKNETYLTKYPEKMRVLEKVLRNMKTPVHYLNITRMTDYRKDAHPSIYRKQNLTGEERKSPLRFQDCSHWCLPGVPDSWNELLYAEILINEYKNQQQQQKQKQQEQQQQQKEIKHRKNAYSEILNTFVWFLVGEDIESISPLLGANLQVRSNDVTTWQDAFLNRRKKMWSDSGPRSINEGTAS